MSQSSYRVPRSPVDQFFDKGPPPPPTRMGSGDVLSVESDTVTVTMHGTVVAGVAIQGDLPDVGDQIDVWSQEDLLYSPGSDDGDSSGGADNLHIVSTARPGSATASEVPIAGSFGDDSWFFEALDMPDWAEDAREDGTGLEVTRDGPDEQGVLWSSEVFVVRPGDQLVFNVSATYLDGIVATMQTMLCWGEEGTEPLPGDSTNTTAYSPVVSVDGVEDELECTVVVPSTVSTVDGTIVPLVARVGIRFTANDVHSYPVTVMSFGPLWYFRFENTSTNVDSSGHGHTWNNNYANSSDVAGLYSGGGRARSYPGTASSQLTTTVSSAMNTSFTLTGGFNVIGGTGGSNSVAGVESSINAGHTVYSGFESDGRPFMQCWDGVTDTRFTAPASVTGGTHHVVWRWNHLTFDVGIWVDGVRVLTGNNGRIIRLGSGARMFAGGDGLRFYKGTLDEVAWYDKLLSDTEIATLYTAWAAGL